MSTDEQLVNGMWGKLGRGSGGLGPVFPAILFCFVSQSNDAGVLVGETGPPARADQTSTFGSSHHWA